MSAGVRSPAEKLPALELFTLGIERLLLAETSHELEHCHSITEKSRNFIYMTLWINFLFTARYETSHYIRQIPLVLKGLKCSHALNINPPTVR